MALLNNHSGKAYEAGCDEAGRGCLAGPVFAASFILPIDFYHADLNDSKQLTEKQRVILRKIIEAEAISYAVAKLDAKEIDTYNILWASVRAMHKSLNSLKIRPEHVIVDGNKFIPYRKVPHDCIIRGDSMYTSIAAASVLAKTYRDDFMEKIHQKYPFYGWDSNKGYPTKAHRSAILQYGPCDYHRKSFQLYPHPKQLILFNNTN